MDVHQEDGDSASHAVAKTDGRPKRNTDTPDKAASERQASPPTGSLIPVASQSKLKLLLLTTITVLLVLAYGLPAATRNLLSVATSPLSALFRSKLPPPDFPPPTFHHLAQYCPYFALEPSYVPPPDGCTVDQVSILQRHGSRYPTSAAARVIQHTVDKLKRAAFDAGCCAPKLQFLREWQYTLGEEDLVPLGAREARDAAVEAYHRYSGIALEKGVFVRTSSSARVQQSATEWREGSLNASYGRLRINEPLVISDAAGSNDTLANNGCPRHVSRKEHWAWADVFTPPIAKRLGRDLADLARLDARDIIVLFGLCAFDSVALEQASDFCGLLKSEEILDFEYFQDLEKYYNRGYGNPLGPVQGMGYVNELLARLQGRPVDDATQTNHTLNDNPATFPLDKGVYADFSHDNTMAAIVSAMGLFHDAAPLPATHRPPHRVWKFGHIAPFAGRLVFERMNCSGTPHIRILGDDAVLPLPFCAGEAGGDICTLDNFVKSQRFARVDGQRLWEACGWQEAPGARTPEEAGEDEVRHDSIT